MAITAESHQKWLNDRELIKAKILLGDTTVDENYINQFSTNASRFLTDSANNYSNIKWGQSQAALNAYNNEATKLKYQKVLIEDWLSKNAEKGSYKEVQEWLNSVGTGLNDIGNSYRALNDSMSGFKTADEYNAAVDTQQKYEYDLSQFFTEDTNKLIAIFDMVKMKPEQYDEEVFEKYLSAIGKMPNFNNPVQKSEYLKQLYYNEYIGSKASLDINSEYNSALKTAGYGSSDDFEKAYNYAKEAREIQAQDAAYKIATDDPDFEKYVEAGKHNNELNGLLDKYAGRLKYMNEHEKEVFYYLGAKKGLEAVNNYVENTLMYSLIARERQATLEEYEKFGENHPYLATALSIPANIVGSTVGAFIDTAEYLGGKNIYNKHTPYSQGINIYDPVSVFVTGVSHMQSAATDSIVGDSKVGRAIFDTVYAALDNATRLGAAFAVNAATGGSVATVTSLLCAIPAGDLALIEAKERGLSDDQAFLLGIASGAAEYLTEKFSIEKFLSNPKGIVNNILKNTVVEASEEAAADLLNTVADIIIAGDKSKFITAMEEYQSKYGVSEDTAFKHQLIELLKETGYSALVGGLTGGIMGGGQSIINRSSVNADEIAAQYAKIGSVLKDCNTNSINSLLSFASNSSNPTIANMAFNSTAENISDADLGMIYADTESRIAKEYSTAKNESELQTVFAEFNSTADSDIVRNLAYKNYTQAVYQRTVADKAAAIQSTDSASESNVNSTVDSVDENGYNSERGENYVRTDEFRRLQEESQRMSDEEIQLYHSGEREVNEELRKNISGILRSQIDAARNGVRNDYGILNLSAKGNQFNLYENVNGNLFRDCFDIARNYLKNGELVDLHGVNTTDEGIGYKDCFNYLSEDGLSGFSITPDGDLISVFNASGKPGFLNAIAPIVREKAKTLDCYNSSNQPLMGIYSKVFGFKTASVMDYNMEYDHDNIAENHGNPQVAFMVNTDAEVETKHFTKDQYDEAKEYRDGFVKSESADSSESASFMPENESVLPDLSAEDGESDSYEAFTKRYNGTLELTEDQRLIQSICKALGTEAVFKNLDRWVTGKDGKRRFFSPDGYFDKATGKIYINTSTNGKHNPLMFVIKHELTHFGEINKTAYDSFVKAVKKSKEFEAWLKYKTGMKGETADRMAAKLGKDIRDERSRYGVELGVAETEQEVIANFAGDILFTKSGKTLDSLLNSVEAKQKPKVIQAVVDFFRWLREKLSGNKDLTFQLQRLESKYTAMLKSAQTAVQNKNSTGEGGKEYSFAGERAANADKSLLEIAKQRTENGEDSETVRKETGWFKGYDGKWRFEIDDSNIKYYPGGDALFTKEHPEYAEYRNLEKKFIYGTLTDEENNRLKELNEIWGREHNRLSELLTRGVSKLRDIIDHDVLFKNYPQLEKTTVVFDDLPEGSRGEYDNKQNKIILSNAIRNSNKTVVKTLIHEVQHAVQHIEGFATGSNTDYWANNLLDNALKEKNQIKDEILEKADSIAKDTIYMYDEYIERLSYKGDISESEFAKAYDRAAREISDKNIEELFFDYAEANEKYYFLKKSIDTKSMIAYRNTAGEIEARDVSNRLDYTSEQRRNTRPDIDRTDVVFADGGVSYSVQKTFDEQVDDVINGTHNPRLDLYVTDTPKYLINLNFSDSPILMRNSKVSEILNKHSEMSAEIIKKIPKAIENPLLVLKSKTHPKDSVVIITDISTAKGDMIVPVWANQTGNYIDLDLGDVSLNTNFVASAYGRNTANLIEYAVNNNGVLYQNSDVKKVSQLLARNGLQLSTPLKLSDSDITVPQKAQSVNSNSTQEAREYSISEEVDTEQDTDYTAEFDKVTEQFEKGDITRAEFIEQVKALYTQAGETYGTIPKGETVTGNENFNDPVPKRVNGNKKVRQFARTIIEGGGLTEEMLNVTKQQILSGELSYTPTSNEQNLAAANRTIEGGHADALWMKTVACEEAPNATTIATGEALLKLALDRKDTVKAVQLTAELCEVGTRTAQALQAFSLLKRMGGIGQLYYVQRAVNTLNHDLKTRFKDKAPEIKINETLAEQLAESETEEDFAISYTAIMNDIAAQVPSTFLDKWNAWRYMAMLANPTTHIRNTVGNAVFVPSVKLKDIVATGLEHAFLRGDNAGERTKSAIISKEYKQFAENDYKNVEEIITGSGKMNPKRGIADNRIIFTTKALEALRNFNGQALEKEDAWFLKAHYKRALGGYLQAQNIDLKNVSNETLAKAREYAILEAKKATYRDESRLANLLSKYSNENALANVVIEGVLPFKKTPVNIVKRGVEYSPLGLAKTLTKGIYDLKKGNISATQFIDGIAANFTGTIIMGIGAALYSLGIIRVGFGDDDEDWYNKLLGMQEYSVEICGVSYTIDWAAPVCVPFFIGATVMESLQSADNTATFADIAGVFALGIEPIVELSMLSGIRDTISAARYATPDEVLGSIAENVIMSYFTQSLPTIGTKISNIIDPTRRTNYIDKSSAVPEFLQKLKNSVISKIPGLSYLKPEYVNAWGETQDKGNLALRIFQNFLSPGYVSSVEVTDIDNELKRLAGETGEQSVFPDTAEKKVKFKNYTKNLSADEYVEYASMKGQMSADYINGLIHSDGYRSLTDEQKVEVIENLYALANAKAKSRLSYTYDELNAMHNGKITKEMYNKYNDSTKRAVAEEYFLDGYKKPISIESNGGSAVDYYINQAKKKK